MSQTAGISGAVIEAMQSMAADPDKSAALVQVMSSRSEPVID